jgi:hypothetical protein
MTVDTHEVFFSFDQPKDARNPLLSILQQLLSRPLARDSRAAALLGSQRVLIIDSQQERAQYIAHLLSSTGYRPFVAPTPLDAYTLFLQGTFHPFAIILSEEGAANQFFLTRLSQQFLQRYDWKIPFIRLRVPPSDQMGPRSTGPLANGQMPPRPSSPLNQPSTGGMRPLLSSPQPSRPPAPRSTEHSVRPPVSQPPAPQRPPGEHLVRMRPSSLPSGSPGIPNLPGPAFPLDQPATRGPISQVFNRSLAPLPSASVRGNQRQVEKVSLDGLSIGRYQLKSLIGGNPIGDVYLTYDRLKEQDIALKTIQTNMIPYNLLEDVGDEYNLFQQEVDLLQQFEHPNISRVTSIGKSYVSGFPFIYKTMPYYSAGSLAIWLNQFSGRVFVASEVALVISQLADAIQFLHNRGLLYQNFKLTNILVFNETRSMRDLHIVLSDLPLVRDVINLPKTSEAYRYFAPEQWEGEAFTSSDQYGLAVVAYELLTGRAPFQGNSDAIMRRMHLTMTAPAPSSFNPNISPFVDKVIVRALTKRPEERFESVSAFAGALERASS